MFRGLWGSSEERRWSIGERHDFDFNCDWFPSQTSRAPLHLQIVICAERRSVSKQCQFRPAIPLTMDERIEIVLLARSHNHRDIADAFNKKHPDRRPVTRSCISRLLSKLKETGSIADKSRSGRPRKTDDAASLIVDRFRRNPEMSLRQLAAETGFSRSRIHRIIRTYKRSDDSADKTNLESS